jgi:hypothetical protein
MFGNKESDNASRASKPIDLFFCSGRLHFGFELSTYVLVQQGEPFVARGADGSGLQQLQFGFVKTGGAPGVQIQRTFEPWRAVLLGENAIGQQRIQCALAA